jgi:hypothetical protein
MPIHPLGLADDGLAAANLGILSLSAMMWARKACLLIAGRLLCTPLRVASL